jgi:hypothetical protein
VLLHNWTLHRSMVNTTARPRRGFSVCYIDAGTRQRRAPELDGIAAWPQVPHPALRLYSIGCLNVNIYLSISFLYPAVL